MLTKGTVKKKGTMKDIFLRKLFQLTRVGVGITVQESGVGNRDFLHLAAPIAVGNAAGFGSGVAWRCCYLDKVEEKWITCEVVHPAAEVPPLPSTCWVKAAGGMFANWAMTSAPTEYPWWQGCQRSSTIVFSCVQLETWAAVFKVARAVATRTK